MPVRKNGRSYALPNKRGKRLEKYALDRHVVHADDARRFFVNTRDACALDNTQQSFYGFIVGRSWTD